MQGINIASVYAMADNRLISLHNIRYLYKDSNSCFIEFESGYILGIDERTFEHLLDILSNVYCILAINNYYLIKPNLINYISIGKEGITVYLINDSIAVVPINQEPYIMEYMHQQTLMTQHFQ
jgi:hypothetical protein